MLTDAVWPDVAARARTTLLVVPVGSTEQHGPHLPLGTDTDIAAVLATRLAEGRDDVVVAPALPYGSSGEHAGFAGTLSIGAAAVELVVLELVRSADAFAGVVIVSGHGGNAAPLTAAVATLHEEGRRVLLWHPRVPGGDAHAGRTETSMMLALHPDLVRMGAAEPGDERPIAVLLPALTEHGIAAVSPNGVLGDPLGATADEGRSLLADLAADLADAVRAWERRMSPVEDQGRVAIITGAARGIGSAVARALAGRGWQLVLVDRCADDPALAYALATPDDLEVTVAACGGPDTAHAVIADVRDQTALDAAVAIARDRFGGLDAAVAAAGGIAGGPAWDATDAADDRWDTMIGVNLEGVWRLARVAVPCLLERPEPRVGRFVAVSSAGGSVGLPLLSAYVAAKHGVNGLVRSLAAELGPLGITANAVAPGSTTTAMLDASAVVYGLPDTIEFNEHHLLGRPLVPDEVAALVAWLCGTESGGVTGAVLPVDAGMTAR